MTAIPVEQLFTQVDPNKNVPFVHDKQIEAEEQVLHGVTQLEHIVTLLKYPLGQGEWQLLFN